MNRTIRSGGPVQQGAVNRQGLKVRVVVTDLFEITLGECEGILAELVREGERIVARGHLRDGAFVAREVVAMHENDYMPPEETEALKRARQAANPTTDGAATAVAN